MAAGRFSGGSCKLSFNSICWRMESSIASILSAELEKLRLLEVSFLSAELLQLELEDGGDATSLLGRVTLFEMSSPRSPRTGRLRGTPEAGETCRSTSSSQDVQRQKKRYACILDISLQILCKFDG